MCESLGKPFCSYPIAISNIHRQVREKENCDGLCGMLCLMFVWYNQIHVVFCHTQHYFFVFFFQVLTCQLSQDLKGFHYDYHNFSCHNSDCNNNKKNINNKKRTVYCQFRPYRYIINCGVKNEKQNMKFLFVFFFQLPKYPPPYSVLVYNANGWTRKAGEVKWGVCFIL